MSTPSPLPEAKHFFHASPYVHGDAYAGPTIKKGSDPWVVYGSKTFADRVAKLRLEARLKSR